MVKTAIVIDDETHICSLLGTLLTALGITVLGQAWDGSTGITLFKKSLPDLVLLDINMPGTKGDVVLKEIKLHAPATKVVILSSVNEKAKVMNMIEQGADYYILKENSPEKIAEMLKAALDKFSLQKDHL